MSDTTVNISLRLPPDLASLIDQSIPGGQSRHAFICTTLYAAVRRPGDLDPEIRLGFVELLGGEIDTEAECPECGQPLIRPHIGFLAGAHHPVVYGPICYVCATTD